MYLFSNIYFTVRIYSRESLKARKRVGARPSWAGHGWAKLGWAWLGRARTSLRRRLSWLLCRQSHEAANKGKTATQNESGVADLGSRAF